MVTGEDLCHLKRRAGGVLPPWAPCLQTLRLQRVRMGPGHQALAPGRLLRTGGTGAGFGACRHRGGRGARNGRMVLLVGLDLMNAPASWCGRTPSRTRRRDRRDAPHAHAGSVFRWCSPTGHGRW